MISAALAAIAECLPPFSFHRAVAKDTLPTGGVLRRSFGRITYHAGVPLPTIQRIYGHASLDQTLHYVGVGQEEMTAGFAAFDRHLAESVSGPIGAP
jgi:site-specific recombinase XerD